MFDADFPSREPDAILYAPLNQQVLWRLPWIAAAKITKVPNEYDLNAPPREVEVRLWFQPSDDLPEHDVASRAAIPRRPCDLEVYNAGGAPPEGFWQVHPALEAFDVEYDKDDGANWWARLWLKAD